MTPREVPERPMAMRLSGLEPFELVVAHPAKAGTHAARLWRRGYGMVSAWVPPSRG